MGAGSRRKYPAVPCPRCRSWDTIRKARGDRYCKTCRHWFHVRGAVPANAVPHSNIWTGTVQALWIELGLFSPVRECARRGNCDVCGESVLGRSYTATGLGQWHHVCWRHRPYPA